VAVPFDPAAMSKLSMNFALVVLGFCVLVMPTSAGDTCFAVGGVCSMPEHCPPPHVQRHFGGDVVRLCGDTCSKLQAAFI
jgi:hypothetical protein